MDVGSEKSKKPSVLLWSDLNLHEVRCLQKLNTIEELRSWLAQKLILGSENEQSLKDKILVDLYYYAIVFCKEHCFNEEQIAAFYSIVKRTHHKAMETSFGNLSETYKFFKELVIIHSAKRPPFCVLLFNVNQVKLVHDYMLETYFRHFKLYKYAFTPKITMNLSISYKGLFEKTEEDTKEITCEEPPSNLAIPIEDRSEEHGGAENVVQVEKPEDTPAVKELKEIIESALEEQINKLKESVEQKLKANEESIMSRMPVPPVKSARNRKKK